MDKIPYQKWRYVGHDGKLSEDCRCAFEWNQETNKLEYSKSFYQCRQMEIPTLHEELTCFTNDLTIRYSRRQNAFHFERVERNMNVDVEIYDGETNRFLYATRLDMVKDVLLVSCPKYHLILTQIFITSKSKCMRTQDLFTTKKFTSN
jgi:hypothetical protein